MGQAFSAVGSRDVNVLISGINQRLQSEWGMMPKVYPDIALVDSTSNALLQHYPVEITAYQMMPFDAFKNRPEVTPEVLNIIVEGRDFTTPIRLQSQGAFDDPYSIVKRQTPDAMFYASRIFDQLLAAKINATGADGIGYDGVPFFGAHSTNPGVPGRPTFTNIINAAPNKQGFQRAFNELQQRIGYNGNYLFPSLSKGDVTCLVPTEDMMVALSEVVNAGIVPEPVGAVAAASLDNQLKGYTKRIVVLPELLDATNPATQNRWYMINSKMSMMPPFIVRDFWKPFFKYIPENQYLDYQRMATGFYIQAAGGAGFGIPHTVLRCEF